jgi:AAA+ superfamily predicted ATPase
MLQYVCAMVLKPPETKLHGSYLSAGTPQDGNRPHPCERERVTFLAATTAEIKANYLGQSGNPVKQLFNRSRASAPAILFLDELDVIAPDRSAISGEKNFFENK